MIAPNSRLSRAAAVALLAVVAGGFVAGIAAPVTSGAIGRVTAIARNGADIERYRARLAARRAHASAEDPVRNPAEAARLLIGGANLSEAQTRLQDLVSQRIARAGATAKLFSPVAHSESEFDGVEAVAMDIEFAADPITLRGVLHGLEAEMPRLELRRIEITAEGAEPNGRLRVGARVVGYRLHEEIEG